jgi:hypothetical protein
VNQAEKMLVFINSQIAQGRTVYLQTAMITTPITKKTLSPRGLA